MSSTAADIGDTLAAAGYANMQIANCLLMSRPKSAEEAKSWIAANKDKAEGHIAGQTIPATWTEGVDYYFAEETSFELQEVVVLKRSDGSVKFGLLQRLDADAGQAVVLVEVGPEMNSLKTTLRKDVGKLVMSRRDDDINC